MDDLRTELWWWRLRHRTAFSGSQFHHVVVPPGPGGRPGERVLATSRSVYGPEYEPRLATDGSRDDFRVLVGRRSTLAAVCLGSVAERGEPRESALRSIAGISAWPGMDIAAITDAELAGERAVRYRIILPLGDALTEWKFAHDGWLFVVGVHHRTPDQEDAALATAGQVLSSWRWVEA